MRRHAFFPNYLKKILICKLWQNDLMVRMLSVGLCVCLSGMAGSQRSWRAWVTPGSIWWSSSTMQLVYHVRVSSQSYIWMRKSRIWKHVLENLFTSHEFNMDHYTEINPKMSEISKGLAPVYKRPILGTKKHMAKIIFFGHFLLRLSRNDHSRVISKANFCWVHSILGAKLWNQKW